MYFFTLFGAKTQEFIITISSNKKKKIYIYIYIDIFKVIITYSKFPNKLGITLEKQKKYNINH